MHHSLRYIVNVCFAVLSFIMLGETAGAFRIPEQRLLAKRKISSSRAIPVYQSRQYKPSARRRQFIPTDTSAADCPP